MNDKTVAEDGKKHKKGSKQIFLLLGTFLFNYFWLVMSRPLLSYFCGLLLGME